MATKTRTPIPEETAASVQFASDRTCCVCQIPGRHIQIHHIDEDPSNNGEWNLCVLCLLCHNDTRPRCKSSGGSSTGRSEQARRRIRRTWKAAETASGQELDTVDQR